MMTALTLIAILPTVAATIWRAVYLWSGDEQRRHRAWKLLSLHRR